MLLRFFSCIKGTQGFSSASSIVPAYLTSITCLGVERRLVDCRRGSLSNITSCDKVGAYCTECTDKLITTNHLPMSKLITLTSLQLHGDDLMCQNGDILSQIRPGTIGIVEI